jgi:hypothetical protein
MMQEELSQSQFTKQYDLSQLAPGIYVVMVSAEKTLTTGKFIKR